MLTKTVITKQNTLLETVLEELQQIKERLDNFMLLIPKESIKEYQNSEEIKKAHRNALKASRS